MTYNTGAYDKILKKIASNLWKNIKQASYESVLK